MRSTKLNQPLISIFMPVYNAGDFLLESISSIQNQTYNNWELIAVDDWSTDNSLSILQEFAKKDARIKVYRNGKHRGVAGAGNIAVKKSKAHYLARMDADDIMLSTRLEKQINYLVSHPDTVIVGGQCDLIDKNGKKIGEKVFPLDHKRIYQMMFVSIPIQQPSMMINKKLLPKNFEWYVESHHMGEEVDLLFRLFKYGAFANLPDKLLKYRIHGNNTSLVDPKKTFFITLRTRFAAVLKHGYKPTFISVIITLSQIVLVGFLPKSWIYPIYAFVKSSFSKKPTFSFNFNLFSLAFLREKVAIFDR